ncbi:hypothetical protein D3C74_291210 [compost metagenome]
MLLVLFQFNVLRQIALLAIYTDTNKALLGNFRKQAFVLSLFARYYRSQNLQSRLLRILHNSVNHLLNRLRSNFNTVLRAMRVTYPGEQKAKVVIDFSNRPYR